MPLIVFVLSAVFLVFVGGVAFAHYGVFPAPGLTRAMDGGAALFKGPTRNQHLVPVRHPGHGVTVAQPERVAAGVTLVTSLWADLGGVAGARVLDRDGTVLATWRLDATELWEETPYTDSVAGDFHTAGNYLHGSYLFPNGDLLVNIEWFGLVRMASTGTVVWKLDRRTHHSIDRAEDGTFWISAARMVDDPQDALRRFPGLLTPFVEDLLLHVSPDGAVLDEISVLEVLWASRYQPRISQAASPGAASGTITHLNDIEPLPGALADQYPLFEAGDLLVSLRDLHMVFVVDPETREIRWMEDSLWTRQHDPDFVGDGWITVFDNNSDDWNGLLRGGSRIVRIRPHTGEFERVHPKTPTAMPFFTRIGGKVQTLPNGDLLVTEAQGARVFEVDPEGRLVWQWIKEPEPDGAFVAEVMEGTRYPYTAEQVRAWPSR
ncbi:MAG: hypothetical protein IPM29_26070 [Planctomycetes bacterium]|nr:hypothetical protein [Planctomycetota bacterium]